MSYFKRFPYVDGYNIQGFTYTGLDITRRTGISNKDSLPANAYIEYTVGEGESPIILADRLYEDPDLYWVIMMFNDMFDIEEDWPLNQIDLDTYVKRVYDDQNAIHHYESIATGAWVDVGFHPDYDTIPVTNYEHELKVNDAKRYIKIPHPDYVGNIVAEHNRLIQL